MKSKKTESIINLGSMEIDTTKITLIKHYMAEKGQDSSEFDRIFSEQLNKLIEKMYAKYVPSTVRDLFSANSFALTVNKADTTSTVIDENQEEEVL